MKGASSSTKQTVYCQDGCTELWLAVSPICSWLDSLAARFDPGSIVCAFETQQRWSVFHIIKASMLVRQFIIHRLASLFH